MDAVEEAKLKHGLKPDLPDFYNLILERPRDDARGYGLLYVDVSILSGKGVEVCKESCSEMEHMKTCPFSMFWVPQYCVDILENR